MDYPEEAKPVGSSGGEVRPPRMVSSPLPPDLAGPVVAALARSAEGVPVLNVIEDEELGVTLAAAVGVMEKAPPGDSGGAFVVGLTLLTFSVAA
jgi:hypothetical protein